MFIPWEKVESVVDGRVWLVRCAIVRIRDTPTRIGLQGKPGQSVLAAYERFEQRAGFITREMVGQSTCSGRPRESNGQT